MSGAGPGDDILMGKEVNGKGGGTTGGTVHARLRGRKKDRAESRTKEEMRQGRRKRNGGHCARLVFYLEQKRYVIRSSVS